jgi:hypothetical protein
MPAPFRQSELRGTLTDDQVLARAERYYAFIVGKGGGALDAIDFEEAVTGYADASLHQGSAGHEPGASA